MSDSRSDPLPGVRFVVDSAGNRTAVVIDLERHGELWEDVYDRLLAEQRASEPREPLDAVRRRVKARARRTARG